jgi:hypothetical protein
MHDDTLQNHTPEENKVIDLGRPAIEVHAATMQRRQQLYLIIYIVSLACLRTLHLDMRSTAALRICGSY